jgi:hypothetical protein
MFIQGRACDVSFFYMNKQKRSSYANQTLADWRQLPDRCYASITLFVAD